ncbi:Translin [Dissoconium aciculare CBS 342.82]|uniref:Translin n=1 Tax=Dissoconium aciculare CBS 342.82 TaxID=1314786 RepID=A0A6J3MGN5_9PEZI|nr:Translin [Dissoconium aciculare CBS 342.82]KAF1827121.1 Translin [Dissoconium aciculare CBS 342.82]
MTAKRTRAEMESQAVDSAASPFMPMFEGFRAELDEHHDRRERIIKASRDVTAASKKIIFTLQRIRKLNEPLPQHVLKSNKQYYETISTQISTVSRDLQEINAWRYARQISGGCQEYIEAASFEHYLTTASLLTYEQAVEGLRRQDPNGPGVELSLEDYVLGLYDMTGELMRFAITTMATSGSLPTIAQSKESTAEEHAIAAANKRNILTDMRALRAGLESLNVGFGPFAKEVDKKMDVMRHSVEKVERALYGLVVRGAERPKGWMPDTDGGRSVEVEV